MASIKHLIENLEPFHNFHEIADALYKADVGEWEKGGRVGKPPSLISPGACQKLTERALAKAERLYKESGMEEWL